MHQPKEFCKEYERKLELDADIKKNPMIKDNFLLDYRDRINFIVCADSTAPGYMRMRYPGNYGLPMLKLDAEDLEYLYNKYKKNEEV